MVAPSPASPVRRIPALMPAHLALRLLCTLVGAVFAAPAVLVLVRAASLGTDLAPLARQLGGPLWRSIQLAVLVSVTAAGVGTLLAWLLTRTDLPGRRLWRGLLLLPLVLPSFVGAAAFIAGLAPGGVLHLALDGVGIAPPRRFRGLGAAWLVLSAFTYPYVLLPVSARLSTVPQSLHDSARLLGHSAWSTFVRVTVPHIRASVAASTLLVFLYTLSEFGAVQLVGYDTLTRVVYASRLVDRPTSFGAAALLAVLATGVVLGERRLRGRPRPDDGIALVPGRPISLGWAVAPTTAACALVAAIGLLVPLASLGLWAQRGIATGRVDPGQLIGPARATAAVGMAAAVLAVIAVLPVATASVRHPRPSAGLASLGVAGGFAVPGLVIALSLAYLTLNAPLLGRFYQSAGLLVVAYVVHFGVQALGPDEQGVRSVPEPVRESAALLEPTRWRRVARIDLPLMAPNLVAGGGLVLLSTVKELPATLLLSPIGFSTLATTIFNAYEDGFYAEAGAASLLLVAVSAVLSWLLVLRRGLAG
ncbi:MAG: ABC transporter permease subunit [Acidimicrobiia bacterium]|nr:ABC transporter permease subunit [Acidimicrobiia bacterium]MDH4363254.1 ABC transporter permease subunit [Acidimicrobiia bacterium]